MSEFVEIRPGQVWSIKNYHPRPGDRRYLRVVSTEEDVNDPTIERGPRVKMVNIHTGRHSSPEARLVRRNFRLEQDVEPS